MTTSSAKDIELQKRIDNIIPCDWNNKITDGQKRYRTLENNSASNYPKVKTMFYVLFNFNRDILNTLIFNGVLSLFSGDFDYDKISKELSKYVINVRKPNITYELKKMNQYNRVKYVRTNKTLGDLSITFMDIKDSTIQQVFFKYFREIDYDFQNKTFDVWDEYGESKNNYKTDWGLKLNSNKRIFKSITIAEMFINKLMVYTVHNPVLKSIRFTDNKMGDFSPMDIEVTFSIEGLSNNMLIDSKQLQDVVGKNIEEIGGEDLAHLLQKQWGGNDGVVSPLADFYDGKTIEKYEVALNAMKNEKYQLSQDKIDSHKTYVEDPEILSIAEKYDWNIEKVPFPEGKPMEIIYGKPVEPKVVEVDLAQQSIKDLFNFFKY